MKRSMRSRLGLILTTVGGVVGILGVVAMAIQLKITLTPQMQQVLFYKGLFAASAALIVLGAIYGRRYGREEETSPHEPEMPLSLGERRPNDPVNLRDRHREVEPQRANKEKSPP